jgi:hypothetical protein
MSHQTVENILVFKTSILSENDLIRIAPYLNNDTRIKSWNVDCQDADHVLRIESEYHDVDHFIQVIRQAGFECEELQD